MHLTTGRPQALADASQTPVRSGTYSTVCQGPWARSAAHRKYVSGSLAATRGTARPWGHSLVESHVALGGLNFHAAQVSNPSTMHWHRSRCQPQE